MSAETMLALGEFRFSLATASPDAIDASADFMWAEQAVIGRYPVLQFTGGGAPTRSLKGRIYPQFRGGLEQIDKLREMADRGLAYTMVTASGEVLGEWVILSITQTEAILDKNGKALRIEFSINLKRYAS